MRYLVSEEVLDHICVARRCRHVKWGHPVYVCVCETEHFCLPQIVHCNTGKGNSWSMHAGTIKIWPFWLLFFTSPTCCHLSRHDEERIFLGDLRHADQLHAWSFYEWCQCFLACQESSMIKSPVFQKKITKDQRPGVPARKMKSWLSCIAGQVGVCTVAEEKVNQGTVTMKGSVVQWSETTPAWMKVKTTQIWSLYISYYHNDALWMDI